MFNKREFIFDAELQKQIFRIFSEAEREIIIVSPYIRLYDKIKDSLEDNIENPWLELQICFGKNHKWTKEDIEFIKRFPNVFIVHRDNLHTKFYANEREVISTSLNLLESSFKNNYESGILIEFDSQIAQYMKRYILTAIIYYAITIPFLIVSELLMAIITLDFRWENPDKLKYGFTEHLRNLFKGNDNIIFEKKSPKPFLGLFPRKNSKESVITIDRFNEFTQTHGYCIRSGVQMRV